MICKKFNIPCDYGRVPFSIFSKISKVRNFIVHAKYERIDGMRHEKRITRPYIPSSKLDEEINSIDLNEALEKFSSFRNELFKLDLKEYVINDFKDNFVFILGHSWSSITSIK